MKSGVGTAGIRSGRDGWRNRHGPGFLDIDGQVHYFPDPGLVDWFGRVGAQGVVLVPVDDLTAVFIPAGIRLDSEITVDDHGIVISELSVCARCIGQVIPSHMVMPGIVIGSEIVAAVLDEHESDITFHSADRIIVDLHVYPARVLSRQIDAP